MKRLHVHLNVKDLDQTVRFYNTLFGEAPDKLEKDYSLRPPPSRRMLASSTPFESLVTFPKSKSDSTPSLSSVDSSTQRSWRSPMRPEASSSEQSEHERLMQ